ncbi:hypothetical protein [Actinomycetospora atypica]|uniref:Uncharacterized protein n=1 Tax=Actinomycetospora atypica TaxID=1290095 RepID=A0ABV9YI01_9PSEU
MTDTVERATTRFDEEPGGGAPRHLRGARVRSGTPGSPIRRRRPVHRHNVFQVRRELDPCSAVALVSRRGETRVFTEGKRPTVTDLLRAAGGVVYEVDTGLHHHGVVVNLPARGDEFPFYAWVDIEWRVVDVEHVVRDRVEDVIRALVPAMRRTMAAATRKHVITAIEDAEQAALNALASSGIGARYGVGCAFWVRLSGDRALVHHGAAKRELDQQLELESGNYELRKLRQENEHDLLKERVSAYREYMRAGKFDQAALRLAASPQDASAVADLLSTEAFDERQQAIDFVTRLIDAGVLDKEQVKDLLAGALARLQ